MSPRSRAPKRPSPEAIGPARRAEVMEAALTLVAERGVAGASLRELARRLGMSQPSLYHYFESKEALVRQVVEYCADHMLAPAFTMPAAKEDLPRFVVDQALSMWTGERQPRFLRFLFAVSAEGPEHRRVIRRVMEERLNPAFEVVSGLFATDEKESLELAQLLRMLVYAVAFPLMEERAILGASAPSPAVRAYADWVAGAGSRLLKDADARAGTSRSRRTRK